MRKAALIFMVCAMFAAVLLPTTAQALLQPRLSVNVRDGNAQMSGVDNSAEYRFTAVVRNGWSRSINVTCNFRVSSNIDGYTGFPGTAASEWFGDVAMSGRFRPGTTMVNLVARNWDWAYGMQSQWNVLKRGCFKGPNASV